MHPSIDTRPATIDLSNDVSSVILAGDMSAVLSVNTESTDDLTKAHEEIARLKSMIQQRDVSVAELRERLEKNQQEHEQYRDQAEHEKEELRLQIHECEQLLEDERQAYEENTKSFLKEAQIKDNLADIRIADLESDWKVKVTALTEDLGTTRQNQDDLKQRNHELETHLSTTGHQMERLEREYERYKKDTTAAKEELEMKMEYLLVEMNNSDAAKEEIRQKLSQAREMVTKAENDWFEKNNALEKLKQAHEHACDTVNNLLLRLNPNFTRTLYTGDQDIVTLLDIMGGELKDYIAEMGRVHTQYQTLEANYKDACQNLDIMNDERAEHLNLSGQLATRLDDIRKSVFFEITNQLQLPVNEDEAGAMTKKIITLDTQEDAVAWNELLLAFNMMNTSKFVSRIRKKVKNAHELTRRWQKEYKDLKEKYTKASVAMHEKIAFRNFKVGDMALFLPTRNSTGNPWAAFNINAPHYFLQPSDSLTSQLHSREWIVARITSIVECVVDAQDLNTNPYGLADGLTFYQLEVEHWKNHRHRLKKKKTSEGSSSLSPNLAPADSKQISSSSLTADAPDQDDDAVTRYHRRNTVPIIHQQDIGLASITSSAFMDGPPSGDRYHSAVSSPALSQNANQTSPVSSPNVIHSTTLPFSSQSKTPAPFRRPIPTSPTDNPSPTNDIADPTIAWNFT
ncbi:hypothetical protein DM01DRAFT_1158481 [Hesseltinella vesiculosa]|uniref:Autophagy-related protein 11 n=1 Tax=Hesseltinella vesiculosa TaxID=101127 RepID=A0A1X2GS76_9FUNG|nr:hypothetical protein DM01DRAFT_1158481 [Hesseltinella vesiculosa]